MSIETELPAGRELDVLVAEKVMGLKEVHVGSLERLAQFEAISETPTPSRVNSVHRRGFNLGLSAAALRHEKESHDLRGPGLKDYVPGELVRLCASWHDHWAKELGEQARAPKPEGPDQEPRT